MKISGFYINSATDPFIHDFKLTNEGGFHFETQNELDTFVSRLKYAFSLYMDSVVVVETFEEREAKLLPNGSGSYTPNKVYTIFHDPISNDMVMPLTCKDGEKLNSRGDCVPNEPII